MLSMNHDVCLKARSNNIYYVNQLLLALKNVSPDKHRLASPGPAEKSLKSILSDLI